MEDLTHAEWMSLFVLAINAAGEARLAGNVEATNHYAAVANKCTTNADVIERSDREQASANHAHLVSNDRKAYVEATRLSRLQQENPDLDLDEHGFDRSESGYDPDEDRTP